MEKAKQAISQFTSHDGEHKTEVDRDARAAVTEEHIRPHTHEETTQVVDKEIHQDHHQTVIQPIQKKETLPEVHHHNAAPVIHKEFDHSKDGPVGDADAAKFRDTSVKHDATRSTSNAGAVGSEHVHHHVHQHVQPVIQKDVVEPHVVHNTVAIHETHRAPTVNHGVTTLPVKTLDEYERSKDKLLGEGTGVYDGCAKDVIGGVGAGKTHSHQHSGAKQGGLMESGHQHGSHQQGGLLHSGESEYKTERQAAKGGKLDTANVDGRHAATAGTVAAGTGAAASGAAVPRSHGATGSHQGAGLSQTSSDQSHVTTASGRKVSLKDKLNPFKDADGDGKKGIMS